MKRAVLIGLIASWMLTASASTLAAGPVPDLATEQQKQAAQHHYALGVKRYKEKRFAQAAVAFEQSLEQVDSPNARIMRARALRENGEFARAYEELSRTQHSASELAVRLPKYASTAESAEAEMRELLPKVAVLRIQVSGLPPNSQASIKVAGRVVGSEVWGGVCVPPGPVEINVFLPDGRSLTQGAHAKLGVIEKVDIAVASPADPKPTHEPTAGEAPKADSTISGSRTSLRPWAYIAGGVGVAGLATFAIAGSMSQATHSDLEAACGGGACPREFQSDIDRGKTEQTIANIGLGVGLVGLAAGVTLFILEPSPEEGSQLGLRMHAGPSSLHLGGTF